MAVIENQYYNKLVINGIEFPLEAVIAGNGAPASSINANIGQLYVDVSTPDGDMNVWICIGKQGETGSIWKEVVQRIPNSEITRIVNLIT